MRAAMDTVVSIREHGRAGTDSKEFGWRFGPLLLLPMCMLDFWVESKSNERISIEFEFLTVKSEVVCGCCHGRCSINPRRVHVGQVAMGDLPTPLQQLHRCHNEKIVHAKFGGTKMNSFFSKSTTHILALPHVRRYA